MGNKSQGRRSRGGRGGDRPPKVLPAWMRMHGDLVRSTVGAVQLNRQESIRNFVRKLRPLPYV